MTGEEKRRLLKEQYKRDLQLRQQFLEKVQNMKKMGSVNKALSDMAGAFDDDTDEWINQLNQGSALSEAKMDMAYDQALEANKRLESLAQQAEMEKLAAANLVKQMKQQMGLAPEEEEEVLTETPDTEATSETPETKESPTPPPGKTLGDF